MNYLSQVNLIQHHQTGTSIVINQTPKVFDSVRQRMLSDDECSRLPVALQETKETCIMSDKSFIRTVVSFLSTNFDLNIFLSLFLLHLSFSLSNIHTYIKTQTAEQSGTVRGTASNTGDVWSHDHAVGVYKM